MTKDTFPGSSGRKRQWFARRQVYLRSGQDSQYVELSPMLQIGVALGMAAVALWIGITSYGAFTWASGKADTTALLAKLEGVEQELATIEQERDAALEDASRIQHLEAALADAQALAADASAQEEARTLTAELGQAKTQLEELQLRLSESKADHAALQAKYEAEISATTDASEKTAEEAISLHAQLEEAFGEIETLQEERDTAAARLETANAEKDVKDDAIQRNTDLLKAATSEIERLQETVKQNEVDVEEQTKEQEATISQLEAELNESTTARSDLEGEITELKERLNGVQSVASDVDLAAQPVDSDTQTVIDAAVQAQSIASGLKEAELLATIDDLRAELNAAKIGADDTPEQDDDIASLRERVAVAEAEIERLLLVGLTTDDADTTDDEAAASDEETDPGETERLRSELLTAQADIIKLNADVKAAKQRLAEQAATQKGPVAKPDNSAKLEQQLASTRSQIQQLNKALADAKLREVAIDLALINIVPSPSPPAPR